MDTQQNVFIKIIQMQICESVQVFNYNLLYPFPRRLSLDPRIVFNTYHCVKPETHRVSFLTDIRQESLSISVVFLI